VLAGHGRKGDGRVVGMHAAALHAAQPSWPASSASAGTSSPGPPSSHSTEHTGGSALNQ
jgi:hypothetical protein